ncbi:MAG: PKD domain-containing protein [Owenweeksia sp.]|nr:PKD domain-containing protein [Owenweeksia sp.]
MVATGLSNPPACQATAMFSAVNTFICRPKGTIFDETEEPDTYTWYFPGGKPYNSNAANPLITYNISGTYNVSLVVSNAAGRDHIFIGELHECTPFLHQL